MFRIIFTMLLTIITCFIFSEAHEDTAPIVSAMLFMGGVVWGAWFSYAAMAIKAEAIAEEEKDTINVNII